MAINRPYRRTLRPWVNGNYNFGSAAPYIFHPKYAQSPDHFIRAFLLLLKDLQELFDYVEPADNNSDCYSYRIHALLLRVCVEVEANCKAILKENGYYKKHMTMDDYKKVNTTHRLSSYQVKIPFWDGNKNIRTPFAAWADSKGLSWYQAYNATKHDRFDDFKEAKLIHLLDAYCGLFVLLSAQFRFGSPLPGKTPQSISDWNDGFIIGIGDYFRIKFPDDWPQDMLYDFDWQSLAQEEDPFQMFDYSKID